jgi:RimJ/RimL family protein N-acetyltransferase
MAEITELRGRLSDGVIELRAIADWDIPEILVAHQNDPTMYRRLGARRPPTGAQLGSQVDHACDDRVSGRQLSLTIVQPRSEWCRGRIDVHAIDWERRTAQIGIWVDPLYRNRQFARRALVLASRWLLETVGLRRLDIRTQADNVAMRKVAVAAGYTEAGAGAEVAYVLEAEPAR